MTMTRTRRPRLTVVALAALLAAHAPAADGGITVHKRSRAEQVGTWTVREATEAWDPRQTAVIVCDMWDAHHCLNAVRRVEEVAPRMNQFLEAARGRGALIIHA